MYPYAAWGPPWMSRINGYFFAEEKSGGFWIHAWIFFPSKLVYQISSGSVRFKLENSFSLTFVSRRCSAPFSTRNKSPTLVGVDILTTTREPSCDAVKCSTACLPCVTSVAWPFDESKR